MAYVTIVAPCDVDQDAMRWASGKLLQYAKELGVTMHGEHRLALWPWRPGLENPLGVAAKLACSCGWVKTMTSHAVLTTGALVLHDALKEHVLSFTDPTHYTYYPQGV